MKTKIALLALAALGLACSTAGVSGGGIPQGEIAAVVSAANEGEVQQGNAALARASSPEVRAFAQMMVNEHTAAIGTAREVFSTLGIQPAENATSTGLRDNAQQTTANLATYRGSEYDRRYMDSQIEVHSWVLRSLDGQLIPSARNGALRNLLAEQRAAVATHLERARQIRQGL